jgi:hypothetical protein
MPIANEGAMANDTPEWLAEAKKRVTTAVREATVRDSRRRATAEVQQARGAGRRAARAAYPVFIQEGGDDFLDSADWFYRHWKPYSDIHTVTRVGSIEEVVGKLAARGSRRVSHLTIVTHAGETRNRGREALALPFLRGSSGLTLAHHLEAPTTLKQDHSYFRESMDGRTSFLSDLKQVRSSITSETTIYLPGCTAGEERDFLLSVQQFFGGASHPRVRAPKQFIYYGGYHAAHVPKQAGAQVNTDEQRERLIDHFIERYSADLIERAYDYWVPKLAGGNIGAFSKLNLWTYLGSYPLPLAHEANAPHVMLLRVDADADRPFRRWIGLHGPPMQAGGADTVDNTPTEFMQTEFTDADTVLIYRPDPRWEPNIGEVG